MTDWTALFAPVRLWWGRAPLPAPERAAPALALKWSAPCVPAEYVSLYTYLEHRYASIVVLTFDQMEALLGFALPASARTERDWWTGAVVQTGAHAAAWVEAGRVATPNLPARTVTFERPAADFL
jgi:hypothetical protein